MRYGAERYRIRTHDVIACPTGDATTAHQIINTGTTTLRYLALSTLSDVEVCEYPDSDKTGVFASEAAGAGLRRMFRSEASVDYYDRENTRAPRSEA